ncbi:MAG: competence protein CoiA family protein [Promethearchaeota archaeon]
MLQVNKKASESKIHSTLKNLVLEYFLENNASIIDYKIEKFCGRRFADIFLELKDGEKVAVEIQCSYIKIEELIKRTEDYNSKGIHILWLLHDKGNCLIDYKVPKNGKNIKVSPLEVYLHRMYGGRVYYIDLEQKRKTRNLIKLFALYFSKPNKKHLRGAFRTPYRYYYYRNIYYTEILNPEILCTEYLGVKIARFYDKNFKRIVKEKILSYLEELSENSFLIHIDKAKFKKVLKKFKKSFDNYLIKRVFMELREDTRIRFSPKLEYRFSRIFY